MLFRDFSLGSVLRWVVFRFLRARKFDVVKAKEMLIGNEQWRKDFGVEDIVKYVLFLFLSLSLTVNPELNTC